MTDETDKAGWVFVVVSNPGKNESFLGLHDKEKNIDFIPAFHSRENAESCFLSLPREKGTKYEIQAIHLEELTKNCLDNGFILAMVDEDGKIIRQPS